MRRALILAYYFPPILAAGSLRMARFASFLPEFGWEPTVIAPSSTPHQLDPGLDYPPEKVIRSKSIELSRLGRIVPGGPGESAPPAVAALQPIRRALRRVAHDFLFYPDGQIGWYPGAVTAGREALRRARFDLLYSSSNPVTGHLVARTLSRRSGLPWVAEFRDPWEERLPGRHPYRRHAQKLAMSLGASPTAVVVPTPGLAEHYSQLWRRDVAVVMNGYDTEQPLRHRRPECLTVTHVGNYDGSAHSFQAVWEALAWKAQTGQPPRLRFVGALSHELRAELAAAGIERLVEVTGFLPHRQALDAMMSSSVLIASGFAGEDPVSRGTIRSKLFEYLASGLPVLYVGNPLADAGRLLSEQPGCHVVTPGDVDGVLAALKEGQSGTVYRRDMGPFSRRARTSELAAVFDSALCR